MALGTPTCGHNSRNIGLTESFVRSARFSPANGPVGCRWRRHAALFDREGRVFVLGNAEAEGSGSLARPVGPALQDRSCEPGGE